MQRCSARVRLSEPQEGESIIVRRHSTRHDLTYERLPWDQELDQVVALCAALAQHHEWHLMDASDFRLLHQATSKLLQVCRPKLTGSRRPEIAIKKESQICLVTSCTSLVQGSDTLFKAKATIRVNISI